MEIDIRQLIRTALRLWWVPLLTIVILGMLGLGAGSMMSRSYTATTQLLVPPQQNEQSVISDGSPINTYKSLITSGTVLDMVIFDLDLELDREELAAKITQKVLPGTQIIEISVSDSDPELAANITNSVAKSLEAEVVDLTTGEFQRNMDNLQAESDGLQSQITVLDTRLAELDTPENAENTEAQVQIDQLKRERLRVSQLKSDIDANIRKLTAQISMVGQPIVIMTSAEVPEDPESSSTVLLGLLGAFIGALIGIAIWVYMALRDPKLREEFQVVSHPVLAKSGSAGLTEAEVAVLAARLHASHGAEPGDLVVVSPRASEIPENLATDLQAVTNHDGTSFVAAPGLLVDASSVASASRAAGAVVVAELDQTSLEDLEEVDEILRGMQVPVLGTILRK